MNKDNLADLAIIGVAILTALGIALMVCDLIWGPETVTETIAEVIK